MKKIPLTTQIAVFHTLQVSTVRGQIAFADSPAGLMAARYIIAAKLRNARMLLTNYRQARARAGQPSGADMASIQQRISVLQDAVFTTLTKQEIFLIEAKAAQLYWEAVRIICHQAPHWQRKYPGAEDALNRLLNMGYTILSRRCRETLVHSGLLPQIGILHSENSGDALVHDLSEIFRQAAVDAVVFPFFSRKRSIVGRLPKRDARQALLNLHHQYERSFPYQGRCVRLEVIMREEALHMRQAIQQGKPWRPYKHPWRHGKACD